MSGDAVAMLMGLLFGGLGALTVAFTVLYMVGALRQQEHDHAIERAERNRQQLPTHPYQPPVIVITGAQQPPQQYRQLPQAMSVVNPRDYEEWIDTPFPVEVRRAR